MEMAVLVQMRDVLAQHLPHGFQRRAGGQRLVEIAACAAASSSMRTTAVAFLGHAEQAARAVAAMETWSSWLAEVGMESTLAGRPSACFSETSAAAVTCGIMKPELRLAWA